MKAPSNGPTDQPSANNAPETHSNSADIRERIEKCQTLGEMFREAELDAIERTRRLMPPNLHEKIWRHMLRYYEPWPDWVLKIASEILHVRFPTIAKSNIEEVLKFFHFIFLEAKKDGSNLNARPTMPDLGPKVIGALIGHLLASTVHVENRIKEVEPLFSPNELAEITDNVSLNKFQEFAAPAVGEYLKQKPQNFAEFQTAYHHAEQNTFDKNGAPKETPLTSVYEKILSDWPEIECLSGPKALTEHLSPMLGNQHFDDKYERVKAICKRMRITFKKTVKGQ